MVNKLETVVFQVTTKCPYQCPQCYMERGEKQLPLECAKGVIEVAHSNGAQAIQITGGEPILYDHLLELISHANKHGMYAFVATSGYGASWELYKKLQHFGLTVLCISINNIVEAHNAKSRMTYEESITAIKIAVDCDISCFANVVVSDENIEQLDILGDYLLQLGVQGINLLRPVPSYDRRYVPTISKLTIERMDGIVRNRPGLFFVEKCFGEFWSHKNGTMFICEDVGKNTFFVNADSTFSLCSKKNHIKFNSIEELEKFADCQSIRCSLSVGLELQNKRNATTNG